MKEKYKDKNGFHERGAFPCDVRVNSETFIEVEGPFGLNESIKFTLTKDEIAEFWALIGRARKSALNRIVEQNT